MEMKKTTFNKEIMRSDSNFLYSLFITRQRKKYMLYQWELYLEGEYNELRKNIVDFLKKF